MGKKRKCRMTEEERTIHDKAVKIRKMTDRQIIEYIDDIYKTGYRAGMKTSNISPDKIIDEIKKIKGIGPITLSKIEQVLEGVK